MRNYPEYCNASLNWRKRRYRNCDGKLNLILLVVRERGIQSNIAVDLRSCFKRRRFVDDCCGDNGALQWRSSLLFQSKKPTKLRSESSKYKKKQKIIHIHTFVIKLRLKYSILLVYCFFIKILCFCFF